MSPQRSVAWVARLAGLGLVLLALCADLLGVGEPGFGERQAIALLVGLMLLLASWLPQRPHKTGGSASADDAVRKSSLGAAYAYCATLLLNTLLAFALLNGIVFAAFAVAESTGWAEPQRAGISSPWTRLPLVRLAQATVRLLGSERLPTDALNDAQLAQVYPDLSRSDVKALLEETRGRPLSFAPFIQFQETPFAGRYVNVLPPGFRLGPGPQPWPPPAERQMVWVFGGSTTFGYGLPDSQTIPAALARALAHNSSRWNLSAPLVYNFGQAYFYSSQEVALFTSLLADGLPPPHVVVFVDGINEHFRRPFYSGYLERLTRLPLASLWRRPQGDSALSGGQVAKRWLRNRRLVQGICRAFGCTPLFVWQPAPDWGYDLRHHALWWPSNQPPEGDQPLYGNSPHYAAMAALHQAEPERFAGDVLWLADLQRGIEHPLYVDRLHYTAAMSQQIAEEIARALAPRLAPADAPAHAGQRGNNRHVR